MTRFHVSATSHWPNYLPEYIARARGFFAAEGIDFERSAPPDWTEVLTDLEDGRADVALGGIWVPAMYHRRGRELVAFAALNSRNPKVLVMREPQPQFAWTDLEDKTVLAPGAGGTAPYLHTAGLMRRDGVDMSKVRWVRDLAGSTLTEMFVGGHGDALVVDAFNGALLESRGEAAIVARHDVDGGRMPNSVYYTTRAKLAAGDDIWRFCRGLQRAYEWLGEHSAEDAADVLRENWPDLDLAVATQTVDELRARGLWEDIRIDAPAYASWVDMMVEDGLVSTDAPYAEVVDPRPADAAVALSLV